MSDYAKLFDQLKREKGLRCTFESAAPGKRSAIGTCELYQHRISLYHATRGTITYRYVPAGGGDKDAESARTGTKDVAEAFIFCEFFLVKKAGEYLRNGILPRAPVGLQQDESTIADAFDYIRSFFRKDYKPKQWREILRILHCAEAIWDIKERYTGLDGADISRYMTVRTEIGLVLPKEFSRRPTLEPCRAATAVNDLRMLAALMKKLQGITDKASGQRPFAVNPFSWLLIPEAKKALRAKPTPRRFEVLMEFVDRVDPSGQLRLALVMVYDLGRRIGAVSQLDAEDLKLTIEEMLATIRLIDERGHQLQDGIQSEEFAYEFLQGGIFFDTDRDKEGFQRLVPNSTRLREEIDLYLQRNPELNRRGPLFPSAGDPRRPTTVVEFIEMLHATEDLARKEGYEKEVPFLYNSVFHGYRGLRASLLKSKGHRSGHVRFIVGWSCKVGSTMEARYLIHDPRLLYAAVEGLRPVEIEQEYIQAVASTDAENDRLREQNAQLNAQLASMEGQNAALAAQMERMAAQMEQFFARFP